MQPELLHQIMLAVLAGEATDSEYEALNSWLGESADNQKEYEQIKRLYQTTRLKHKERVFDVNRGWQNVFSQTIAKRKKSQYFYVLRYAAILLAFICTGTYMYTDNKLKFKQADRRNFNQPTLLLADGEQISLNNEAFSINKSNIIIKKDSEDKLTYNYANKSNTATTETNRLIIPRGASYQLVLSDGTKIYLNSDSELTYPSLFNTDTREVTLRGEAYFEVTKDAKRPFIVKTEDVDVKVLGTCFNVMAYESENTVEATLVSGSVCVTANKTERIITPNEQFSFNKEKQTIAVATVNTEEYTSWMSGKYIFKNTTLEEILTKLEHWHHINVNFENESLKEIRFSLAIERETPLQQIINIINYTTEAELEIDNNSINVKKYKGGNNTKKKS